ncbi:MAG: hypothetical protein HXY28_04175 [Hydrogenophilaceae bacterium]|jgi:hypothetical protein|nr:hypothetical protein [Hydrogenophilaceae bacterium]
MTDARGASRTGGVGQTRAAAFRENSMTHGVYASRTAVAALLTLAAVACAAPAQSHPPDAAHVASDRRGECVITATSTRGGVRIEADAESRGDGEYSLVIVKRGPDGESSIVQGGALRDADPDSPLAGAEISLERGARFRATLTIHDSAGVTCRDEIRS